MSIGPAFLVVVDGSETELRLEGAKDGFHIREHGVRLPHSLRVPVETIRPQAVDTGLVQHGPFGWVKGPRNRHRPRVCRIRCDGDIVVLGDPDARIKAFASHGAVRSCVGCRPGSSGFGVSRDRHGGRAIRLQSGSGTGRSCSFPSSPARSNGTVEEPPSRESRPPLGRRHGPDRRRPRRSMRL